MAMYRRSAQLVLFLIVIFICFCVLEEHRNMWIFLAICLGSFLLTDLMFLGENQFIYDPFYPNWIKQTTLDY